MVKMRDIEAIDRKRVKNSLKCFLEGRQGLKWAVGIIKTSSFQGQSLEVIFQELQGYGDPSRWQEAYKACQENGWL